MCIPQSTQRLHCVVFVLGRILTLPRESPSSTSWKIFAAFKHYSRKRGNRPLDPSCQKTIAISVAWEAQQVVVITARDQLTSCFLLSTSCKTQSCNSLKWNIWPQFMQFPCDHLVNFLSLHSIVCWNIGQCECFSMTDSSMVSPPSPRQPHNIALRVLHAIW